MGSPDTRPFLVSRPSLKPNPREKGLVAAYDFGDSVSTPTGQFIYDVSSGGFNGAVNGGAVTELTPLGKGLSLDGADDFVNLYDGRISNATSGSMGFWVKIRTLADGDIICSFGGAAIANPGLFALHLRLAGGNYYFGVEQRSDGTAVMSIVRGSTVLRVNVWYYVELTSDGAAWQLYVNNNTEVMTVVAGANDGNWFGDTTCSAPTRTRVGAARYNGNDQDYFDGVVIAGTISTATRPENYQKAEYLRGRTAGFATRYGVAVSSADEGGVLGDTLGRASGVDSGCRFGDTTGRWRFETTTIQGKRCKVVTNVTALGTIYLPTAYFQQTPTEAAFGSYKLWFYLPNGAPDLYWLIAASYPGAWNNAAQNGYRVRISGNTTQIFLDRITGGASALTPFSSNGGVFSVGVWNELAVDRQTSGIFTLKLNGNLMVAGGGANPTAAETVHTTANYQTIETVAALGCKVSWSDESGAHNLWKGVIAQ